MISRCCFAAVYLVRMTGLLSLVAHMVVELMHLLPLMGLLLVVGAAAVNHEVLTCGVYIVSFGCGRAAVFFGG